MVKERFHATTETGAGKGFSKKSCRPTNLQGKPHKIIAQYDKRADAENLIGETKREGLDAIPSAKFKNNYAYFQIALLAYNLWRWCGCIRL